MTLSDLTRSQVSLLLYLERMAVEYGGKLCMWNITNDQLRQANAWSRAGFILFDRLDITAEPNDHTHWCQLSERAWTMAHEARRLRGTESLAGRTWRKRDESWALPASESQYARLVAMLLRVRETCHLTEDTALPRDLDALIAEARGGPVPPTEGEQDAAWGEEEGRPR